MPERIETLEPRDAVDHFRTKLAAEVDSAEVAKWLKGQGPGEELVIIDVRDPQAFKKGHVKGAVNIPFADLKDRLADIPRDALVLAYCYDVECMLSAKACLMLAEDGRRAKDILGGFEMLEKKGAPIETGEGRREVAPVGAS